MFSSKVSLPFFIFSPSKNASLVLTFGIRGLPHVDLMLNINLKPKLQPNTFRLSEVGQLCALSVDSGSDSRKLKSGKLTQSSVKNLPDDISMMKMSHCRVDDGDDTNIRAVTDIVVDDELEVGDVDQGQILPYRK